MPKNAAKEDLTALLPLTPAVFFILFALSDGNKHGYLIMQEVAKLSDHRVHMGPGTLYTTIQRLLELEAVQEVSQDPSDRRRYYRLTRFGKNLLKTELNRQEAVLQKARQKKLLVVGIDG